MDSRLKEKMSKRGYAYRCPKCDVFKGEKRYVKAHIYKYHVALDVPFYCSLCHFIAKTEREVTKHTKGYKPHKEAEKRLREEGKPVGDPTVYIHKNNVPIELGGDYLERLSFEESQLIWISSVKTAATATSSTSDDITQLPETVPATVTIITRTSLATIWKDLFNNTVQRKRHTICSLTMSDSELDMTEQVSNTDDVMSLIAC